MKNGKLLEVILPLTTAAKCVGMKVDSLVAAMHKGELRIRFARMKPGGKFQPLVSVADLQVFARSRSQKYIAMPSAYHRKMGLAASANSIPPGKVDWHFAFGGLASAPKS